MVIGLVGNVEQLMSRMSDVDFCQVFHLDVTSKTNTILLFGLIQGLDDIK